MQWRYFANNGLKSPFVFYKLTLISSNSKWVVFLKRDWSVLPKVCADHGHMIGCRIWSPFHDWICCLESRQKAFIFSSWSFSPFCFITCLISIYLFPFLLWANSFVCFLLGIAKKKKKYRKKRKSTSSSC